MQPQLRRLALIVIAAVLIISACASEPTPPPMDTMATAVAQAAYDLLTLTAAAASATPPPPTITPTPSPTETPTLAPTSSEPIKLPVLTVFAGCWVGPGPSYTLISNISKGARVEIIGVGDVPGWYIIRNPYFHNPCWVEAINLKIDPRMDLTIYPVMTPTQ
jgi:hypothetical protein